MSIQFASRTFPARVADLGFTVNLPDDFVPQDLPSDPVDFANPGAFALLAVVTAPHAAIIYAFAARPAYDDGTLHDWALYLINQNNLKPQTIAPAAVGPYQAIVGQATQAADLGEMTIRFAFFEDGGRLMNITLSAPTMLADAIYPAWAELLCSFTLATPRGQTTPLMAGQSAPPPTPPATEPPPLVSADDHAAPAKPASAPPATPANDDCDPPSPFVRYALADNDASLNPDHPINDNLRQRGIGLTPNLVATDDQARRAIVASGAVLANVSVPFGWHVIDDGKRALVFEPSGQVQINLNLIARNGRDNAAIFDALQAEAAAAYPGPEFLRLSNDGIDALGVRNIADDDQPIEQYHMLIAGPGERYALRARVTATPPRAADACNLAEIILRHFEFVGQLPDDDTPEPPAPDATPDRPAAATPAKAPPQWWAQAQALEQANRLEEAEQLITQSVQHIGAAASIAELYAQRMERLARAGDAAGAKLARAAAEDWIANYASYATSGGEGAALSQERDDFLAELARRAAGR